MADRRKIRKMKKEFEKLVKQFGTDNLCNPTIIEKSIELERELYDYLSEYRLQLAQSYAE